MIRVYQVILICYISLVVFLLMDLSEAKDKVRHRQKRFLAFENITRFFVSIFLVIFIYSYCLCDISKKVITISGIEFFGLPQGTILGPFYMICFTKNQKYFSNSYFSIIFIDTVIRRSPKWYWWFREHQQKFWEF